jgi:hypothetical protein
MVRLPFLFFPMLALLAVSCRELPPPFPMEGTWQATSLTVADSLWAVETTPVRLFLDPTESYTLQWYGRDREEGAWDVDYPRLLIRPHERDRRSLMIAYLDADSLVLEGKMDTLAIRLGFRRLEDSDHEQD